MLVVGLGAAAPASAAPPEMVDLGAASTYAALSGASVGNTVSAPGAPHTTLRGDLGVKANAQPTGFPPGIVTGAKNVGNAAAIAAHDDLVAAYTEVAGRTGGAPLAGALAGTTIGPGLHAVPEAVSNTTTVTLDAGGDPDAVFVFQVNGALAMAAGSKVVLAGGARASRVFWQVKGAGAVGANAAFAGTLMALDAVGVGNSTVVNGRALALGGALTLDANEVYGAPPVVTLGGGANATTTDTTPTVTGTTDVTGTDAVTVTVGGQTLAATPVDGAWSATSGLLPNGTYAVVATVTDGAGNVTRATQSLTVDTVLPVVTLDGGPTVLTNDPTPTISGTSDVAAGSIVRVAVGTQALTAVVRADGEWNVTPATLTDGARTVVASVTDPAGNDGTASQALVVDTIAPGLSITGGAAALTNDATPRLSGTADVPADTVVTVALADETLFPVVDGNHAWSTRASPQAEGPRRVAVTVADPAGNTASVTQILTVDTIAPRVTIDGGAAASTPDTTPTITGTSDAAAGTVVTVAIAGQTIAALVQSTGIWNATPTPVGPGTWAVEVSVPDPAGNLGRASQALTVAGVPAPLPGGSGVVAPPPAPSDPVAGATAEKVPAPVLVPGPAPSPPGAPGVAPAARAVVAGSARQRLGGTRLSIATNVRAPAAGRVVVTVRGSVRIAGQRRTVPLTTATARIAAGGSAAPTVRPRGRKAVAAAAFRRIRTAARRGTAVTARLTVRVVDAAGNVRTVRRSVRLTR
ncbi:Ig-like domain-containing protein [Patulibacter americanus]|uniref:Ig-like domain-containing protein n=1 Tax=Patulibacter americanus TaxID=588672 RepID=UPI0003B60C00|nr:Ig-like domain-containing protein [Patulibacter americanus]